MSDVEKEEGQKAKPDVDNENNQNDSVKTPKPQNPKTPSYIKNLFIKSI